MDPKKKGAVGPFEVWHVGPSKYEVRRAGELLRRTDSLNAGYRAAEQFNRNQRFAEIAAAEIERNI